MISLTLPGPSRTIIVEPVEQPATPVPPRRPEPAPEPAPEPQRPTRRPRRRPEREPARSCGDPGGLPV